MIAPSGHDHAHGREIARGLAAAVSAAVAAARAPEGSTRTLAWGAAMGVAELLELQGLVALLTACEVHADAPPLAVANVLERLARLATETKSQGDIAPFVAADRELAALAGMLSAQDWATPNAQQPTPVSVQSLAELLADFKLDDAAAIARAQVSLPVAAGLRAALDWLGADLGADLGDHLRVTAHDASLTLAVRVTHEPGLGPAGAVLGLMGGALLPEPDGRWALRVPLYTGRPAYLLARQGELSLALPWHAVARLRIVDDAARSVITEPSLGPWSPLARPHGERPAALLAQGLSRAWLHLDHIVWRVFASPEPGQAPAAVPGAHLRVRTEEGAEFWVVDVEAALRGVPQLHTPPPRPRTRAVAGAETAIEYALSAGRLAASAPEPAPENVQAAAPTLLVLSPEHVRPLGPPRPQEPVATHEPRHTPALEPTPARFELDARDALPPAPVEPAVATQRRALIVDDSLVARIALARVLEREGWVVEGVERAEEMWVALQASAWSVVFVDVCLPDASGRAHLRALVARQLAAQHRFEVVALTRDGAEQRLAEQAGITCALRKPFAHGVIEALIHDLPARAVGA